MITLLAVSIGHLAAAADYSHFDRSIVRVCLCRLLSVLTARDSNLARLRCVLTWRMNAEKQISDRKRLAVALRLLVWLLFCPVHFTGVLLCIAEFRDLRAAESESYHRGVQALAVVCGHALGP
jgi:hypothetical protein